jgi:putative protease
LALVVWDDEKHYVAATDAPPVLAEKQPITREDVEKRMRKTGDTAFLFDDLHVELDDGLFVPNGVLNQLRRDALALLQERILWDFRREEPKISETSGAAPVQQKEHAHCEKHIASTENRALLPAILSCDRITHVYLDSAAYDRDGLVVQFTEDAASCHRAGKQVYFILPSIFREHTAQFYRGIKEQLRALADGFVVKNLESFFFVQEHFPGVPIVCDHNLYTYNDAAVDAFLKAGADFCTVPFELNRKEIFRRQNAGSEIWVYGYYPLMTTAQCVCKNSAGCTHTPGIRYLVDRCRKRFAVKNCCAECYNTIYNSLPTMLFANVSELRDHGIRGYRIHFSTESVAEAAEVLSLYERVLSGDAEALSKTKQSLYTNGHYKRGVE